MGADRAVRRLLSNEGIVFAVRLRVLNAGSLGLLGGLRLGLASCRHERDQRVTDGLLHRVERQASGALRPSCGLLVELMHETRAQTARATRVSKLLSNKLFKKCLEGILLKMMITSQRFVDVKPLHNHERRAVSEAPFLVRTCAIQVQGIKE